MNNIIDLKNGIKQFLTDDSLIKFCDGKTVKGSEDVSNFIANACDSYLKGFLEGKNIQFKKGLTQGIIAGVLGNSISLIKFRRSF